MASMSYASARVTTSAASPSITDRACLPEPPCDCCTVILPPPLAAQLFAKLSLTSWYNSRVGSYYTLRSFTLCPVAARAESRAVIEARTIRCQYFIMVVGLTSEAELNAAKHRVLVASCKCVFGFAAVLEVRRLKIEVKPDVAIEVPVQPDSPGSCLLG